jgi:F0F1-type ATP synthase membrane subunit b/b'
MDSSFPRPCETFLKRSWRGAATVFAALIALSGVPIEDAQARTAPRSAQAAPANQTPQTPAQPQAQAHVQTQAQPAHPDAGHAAQPAAGQAVESTQPPAAAPAPAAPHAAPADAPSGEHAPAAAPGSGDAAHGQPTAHGPPAADGHAATGAGHGTEAAHAETIWPTIARLFNFAVLVGGLVYFLRSPLAQHLASRTQQIRGGLEAARETTATATAQLAEIDRRLQSLPAELEALRARGIEEIAAEERRIQAKAEAERKRLVEEMQRDVDVRVRVARQALAEHAADLAVGLAADRVRQTITDADQARLIDRYATQVKDIHG